jgi:hypothetical protein
VRLDVRLGDGAVASLLITLGVDRASGVPLVSGVRTVCHRLHVELDSLVQRMVHRDASGLLMCHCPRAIYRAPVSLTSAITSPAVCLGMGPRCPTPFFAKYVTGRSASTTESSQQERALAERQTEERERERERERDKYSVVRLNAGVLITE